MAQDDKFAELEAALHQHQLITEKEHQKKWLRPIGFVARLMVYAALFITLYIFRPDDISDVPLAKLTISIIFKTVIWAAVGIWLIKALFNPTEEQEAKDRWGNLGLLMIGAAFVVGALALIITQMNRGLSG